MARVVTRSAHIRRNSMDDRVGSDSKFRSNDPAERAAEALEMGAKRLAELEELLKARAKAQSTTERRRIDVRIRAAKNNLAAWQAYVAKGAKQEPKAVIGSK